MPRPTPPSNVKIDGKDKQDGMATKSIGQVLVEAELNDPDGDKSRLVIWYSRDNNFDHHQTAISDDPVASGQRTAIRLFDLDQDTHYFLRLFARSAADGQDSSVNPGANSPDGVTSANFWTNRSPNVPTLVLPVENEQLDVTLDVTFDWQHHDPDPSDDTSGYRLQYRTAGSVTPGGTGQPGDWQTVSVEPDFPIGDSYQAPTTRVIQAGAFKANFYYEWRVRTRDHQGRWGDFCTVRSFFMTGVTKPPLPLEPVQGQGRVVTDEIEFHWRFRDPAPNQDQARADIRFRVIDTPDWTMLLGDATTPGSVRHWALPAGTFVAPGYNYEWQVRTYNRAGLLSDWSDSAEFWTARSPGSAVVDVSPVNPVSQGTLGCGEYRVCVYDQGGMVYRGEITPIQSLQGTRKRDDISNLLVATAGFSDDCGQLLKKVRCWTHELVVFRDGVRVWEGPVTRITYTVDGVAFEAKDVMAYVYRRVLRQGFNDSWRIVGGHTVDGELVGGTQVGLPTVVQRARQIIIDALARHDPNVLGYMTTYNFKDDALTSRVVADYSSSAWQVIDDMAANAGLDYTVMGRRIILWDVHRPLGRLPELRDGDFHDPPVVSEYGMQLCNYFAVTNNSGVWGAARPRREDPPNEFYGPIEMVASSFGESDGSAGSVLTPQARERLEHTLEEQAHRNIGHRWPTPIIVRVPDNSALSPDAEVGFQQLVPGVHIPVRATATLREVTQWQKLDSVTFVASSSESEQVQVVLSPAPNGGENPDEGQADGEA